MVNSIITILRLREKYSVFVVYNIPEVLGEYTPSRHEYYKKTTNNKVSTAAQEGRPSDKPTKLHLVGGWGGCVGRHTVSTPVLLNF